MTRSGDASERPAARLQSAAHPRALDERPASRERFYRFIANSGGTISFIQVQNMEATSTQIEEEVVNNTPYYEEVPMKIRAEY